MLVAYARINADLHRHMEGSSRRTPSFVFIAIAVHTLLIACYTLPARYVPEALRVQAQRYVRPVFHQQWRLFAPDPPTCSCRLEMQQGDGPWEPVEMQLDHYLARRMARSICHHLGSTDRAMEARLRPALHRLLAVSDDGTVHFRRVERCVLDAQAPERREEHVRKLFTP